MNLAPPFCKFDTTPIMLNTEDLFPHGIQKILCPFDEELLYDEGIIIDGSISISFVDAEVNPPTVTITSNTIDYVLSFGDPYAFLKKSYHVGPKVFSTRKGHKYVWWAMPNLDMMGYPSI